MILHTRKTILETKRTSITRLKHITVLTVDENSVVVSWTQKNLDYEIETVQVPLRIYMSTHSITILETKRTSITRLKLRLTFTGTNVEIYAWNQKNLDYEIETLLMLGFSSGVNESWNQKNLDYEIETWMTNQVSIALILTWN